jgi:hypothetical protein
VQLPAAELHAHAGQDQDHQGGGEPAGCHQSAHPSNLSHRMECPSPGRPATRRLAG